MAHLLWLCVLCAAGARRTGRDARACVCVAAPSVVVTVIYICIDIAIPLSPHSFRRGRSPIPCTMMVASTKIPMAAAWTDWRAGHGSRGVNGVSGPLRGNPHDGGEADGEGGDGKLPLTGANRELLAAAAALAACPAPTCASRGGEAPRARWLLQAPRRLLLAGRRAPQQPTGRGCSRPDGAQRRDARPQAR